MKYIAHTLVLAIVLERPDLIRHVIWISPTFITLRHCLMDLEQRGYIVVDSRS